MTNPTLLGQDTGWAGWTFEELMERILAGRGLTMDPTTGRTPATAAEETAARDALYRAINLLPARFPSLWDIRTWTTAWVSGDHSVALPQNTMAVLAVTFDGLSMSPMSRDDYYRLLRPDDEGGDTGDASRPTRYRVVGASDQGVGSVEWRVVMRLHPEPATDYAGKQLVVQYVSLGVDVQTSETDPMPLFPFLQGWCLERGRELWAVEAGDGSMAQVAEAERMKHERDINSWIDSGTRQGSSRMRWRYPNPSRGSRYR